MDILRPFLVFTAGVYSALVFLGATVGVERIQSGAAGGARDNSLLAAFIAVGAVAVWGWWGALPPRQRRSPAAPGAAEVVVAENPTVLTHRADLQARLDAQLDSATAVVTSAADSWLNLPHATSPHAHLTDALREDGIWGSESEPGVHIARWADDYTTVTLRAWDWDLASPLSDGGYLQMIRQRTLPWPASAPAAAGDSHRTSTPPGGIAVHDGGGRPDDADRAGTPDLLASRQAPTAPRRYLARPRVAIGAAILIAAGYLTLLGSLILPIVYGFWWYMEGKNFWGYRYRLCPRNLSWGERTRLTLFSIVVVAIPFGVLGSLEAPDIAYGLVMLTVIVSVGAWKESRQRAASQHLSQAASATSHDTGTAPEATG